MNNILDCFVFMKQPHKHLQKEKLSVNVETLFFGY